jgi:hypothetical protein
MEIQESAAVAGFRLVDLDGSSTIPEKAGTRAGQGVIAAGRLRIP